MRLVCMLRARDLKHMAFHLSTVSISKEIVLIKPLVCRYYKPMSL